MRFLVAATLGAFQGVLGWIMVQSGLVEKPWVSPYRLTAHLTTALALLVYLIWLACEAFQVQKMIPQPGERKIARWVTVLLSLQILSGGFMSGTRAALFAPTFPDFNGVYFPEGLFMLSPWWMNFFENVIMIQLIHRVLAVVVVVSMIYFIMKIWKHDATRFPAMILSGFLCIQVFLGIYTLVSSTGAIPVAPGVMHQTVAAALLITITYVLFLFKDSRVKSS